MKHRNDILLPLLCSISQRQIKPLLTLKGRGLYKGGGHGGVILESVDRKVICMLFDLFTFSRATGI